MKKFFTSESVTEGHPDKLCDAVSDACVDAVLAADPDARCAVECCAAYDRLLIMGEVTSAVCTDFEKIARETIKKIGYDFGNFAYDRCNITVAVHGQSPDIAQGVDSSLENREGIGDAEDEMGAGDQGMMFGYACNETPEYMPMAITLAHKISLRLAQVRKEGLVNYLRPDGKCQVTVEYDEYDRPCRVDTIVLSTQHSPDVSSSQIAQDMINLVIRKVVPLNLLDEETKYYVNPTGRFEIGGPAADSGLTGRKIIVDTYGGYCAHGGGAFSGKDPTKVDRSATYMARYICKNVVAAGLADKIQLQVSYAIGRSKPVSVDVNTYGTGKVNDGVLAEIIADEFDLRPRAIIDQFKLQRPIYLQTASYGHVGRDGFPWEQLDRVDDLKKYVNHQ